MVEAPGRDAVLVWSLDQAEEFAGGELWSDPREAGRYATEDGVVTVTTWRMEILRDRVLTLVGAA